jgi:hypothetical protein
MRLLKPLAAGILALGLFAGGAYAVAQSAAETAVAEAIARLRVAFGPDAAIEHGTIRAEPISGRVRISSLTIRPDRNLGDRFEVADVVADGLRPGGTGFERLSFHATRVFNGEEERGRIGSITIDGLTIPATPGFAPTDVTLDALDVLDVAWTLPDGTAVHFGLFSITGLGGSDRQDSWSLDNLVVVGGPGAGFERIELEAFQITNARLLENIAAAMEMRAPPTPRGTSSASLTNLLVRANGIDAVRIGQVRSNSEDIEGRAGVQRSVTTINDAVIGLPEDAREALGGLAEIRLGINAVAEIDIDRGDYDVQEFRVEAEGLGAMDVTFRLTGAPIPPIGDPMVNGRLHGFRLTLQDAGLTARALAAAARASGMTEAELRRQIVEGIGMVVGMFGAGTGAPPPAAAAPDSKGGAQPAEPESKLGPQAAPRAPAGPQPPAAGPAIVGSLRGFLERPGRITISAQPAQPVPLAELESAAAASGPQELIGRLGLRIEIE